MSTLIINIIPLSFFVINVFSFNILVYSPSFASSHMNFMAHLADTLTDSGHNVTFLVPIAGDAENYQLFVKRTKDVYLIEQDGVAKQTIVPMNQFNERFWRTDPRTENIYETLTPFNNLMKNVCDNFCRNPNVFEDMKNRNFDVAIAEPVSVCGLGFFKKLGIEKVVLASSCTHFDFLFPHIGEPLELSYVPSLFSDAADNLSILERFENMRLATQVSEVFSSAFDDEMRTYRKFFGEETPDWRDLLFDASLYFTNSNPYIDFPRPVIQKTVPIGGISVDMNYIKSQKLPGEWDEVLNRRNKTMLISFGSLIRSLDMPIKYRQTLLNVIKSLPDVTFIWKYESDNTTFAFGMNNIYFSKWVPQTALLADPRLNAFLTHGGLGSTNELAHCGKPAVMMPIFADQARNAIMLSRHEGVIVVRKSDLKDEKIVRKAISSILNDKKYQKNAVKLANLLLHQPMNPKELVVKHIEFVAQYGPFPQMSPQVRHLNYFQRTLLDIFFIQYTVYISLFFMTLWFLKYSMGAIRK